MCDADIEAPSVERATLWHPGRNANAINRIHNERNTVPGAGDRHVETRGLLIVQLWCIGGQFLHRASGEEQDLLSFKAFRVADVHTNIIIRSRG